MMISPEEYYKIELVGKTAEQIASKIRGLKCTITQLRHSMERPDYISIVCPSEAVQLSYMREYLVRAIEAYKSVGGIYVLTKAEQRAEMLYKDLEAITKLTLSKGGFSEVWQTHAVTFQDNRVFLSVDFSLDTDSKDKILYELSKTKAEFVDCLHNLHIDEWKRNYINPYVLDGTQWELKIEFGNGRKALSFSGSNAHPYNFDELCELAEYDEDNGTEQF